MVQLPFKQMDVFTLKRFKGNPVAVVNCLDVDESSLSTEQLQSVATWTNLSETTFLFKPSVAGADYKLRIFTPTSELPFAGHPTIGSCVAYMDFTGKSGACEIHQECGVGLVTLTVSEDKLVSIKAERAAVEDISEEAIAGYKKCLGVPCISEPKLLQVGPKWVVCLTTNSEACFNANPDLPLMESVSKKFGHTGVILAGSKNSSVTDYEMRAFVPAKGIAEDPVCGSGSLALVRFLQSLHHFKESTNIEITEGGRVGRDGQIHARINVSSQNEVSYHTAGNTLCIIDGRINV